MNKKSIEHWFFFMLDEFYEADKKGIGLSWNKFYENYKTRISKSEITEDHLRTIFMDISESLESRKSLQRTKDPIYSKDGNIFRHLETKMYERLIAYKQLKSAQFSSRVAHGLSIIAILIAAGSLVFTVITYRKTVTLSNETISTMVDVLSEQRKTGGNHE